MSHKRRPDTHLTRRGAFYHAGAATLAGGLVGVHASGGQSDSENEQSAGQAIDTHIHVVDSRLPGIKPIPEDVSKLYKAPATEMASRLRYEMKQAKVQFAFGMGTLEGTEGDPLGIARTLELSMSVPGLKAIGIADPRLTEPEHLTAVEAQIKRHRDKLVALKAYLGYLPFGPDDPKYEPYYKLAAEYRLPVIVHTGDNWSTRAKVKYAHPLRMDEVAVDHPDVRFVLAHFGNPWLVDAAEVVFKNPNVWADLSGLFVGDDEAFESLLDAGKQPESVPGLALLDLKKAIRYVGDYKKFLYGSDWPLAPMRSYLRLIKALIPKPYHTEVFTTNAKHVFSIC